MKEEKKLTENETREQYQQIWIDYEVGNITRNQRDLELKAIKKYIDMYGIDKED
jgi:hypothetical protein